ncbi:MAG: CBS domain-containing protein [Gammaproteobacteria bacterium]|nr:CBS domain-containing protein [Gammaproteobacteria bacterium]
MKKKPNLMTAMTPFPYSVTLDTLFSDARKLMKEHSVNYLPIMDEKKLVGVIARHDIKARKKIRLVTEDKSKLQIKDAYIAKPYVVDIHEPPENVLLAMAKLRHSATLVIKQEKLVGILTYLDVCRYMGNYLKEKLQVSIMMQPSNLFKLWLDS